MKTLGPLTLDDTQALSFRLVQPAPPRPRALLVLLHGVGGDESNLAPLADGVADDVLVVLARGPLAIGPGQFAWFRVAFSAQGPRIDAPAAEASRLALIRLVGQLQRDYAVDPARTVVAGFSQGGILSASVALSAPERVAGFAVLSGRILPELAPVIAEAPRLAAVQGFIAHGERDGTLPVFWAERAAEWLERLGVAHRLCLYPAGHELTPPMARDFLAWFAGRVA